METVKALIALALAVVLSGAWILAVGLGVALAAKVLEDLTEMLIGKDRRK